MPSHSATYVYYNAFTFRDLARRSHCTTTYYTCVRSGAHDDYASYRAAAAATETQAASRPAAQATDHGDCDAAIFQTATAT